MRPSHHWASRALASAGQAPGASRGSRHSSSERFLSTDDADDTDVRGADETVLSAFICVICGPLESASPTRALISAPTRQAEISYAVFCLKKKKTWTSNPQ